jgi:hypothetical protein
MHLVHDNDTRIIEKLPELHCNVCGGDDFRAFAVGSEPRAGGAANEDVEHGDLMLAFECKLCGQRIVLSLASAVSTPTFDLYEALAC